MRFLNKLKLPDWLDIWALRLILLGSFTWVLTMFKSGLPTQWGIGFWGANGHDGVWHIALANSLARGTLDSPNFTGHVLQNYHIGFDVLLALLSKTGISAPFWYFQVLPVVFAVAIGLLVYKFALNWKKSKQIAWWSVFFVYFGGSFGWVITFIRGQGIGGESMFWSQQAVSTLINPPFALSLIILLSGLIFLQKFLSNKKNIHLIIATLLFGSLIEVKAYAGVLALVGLTAVAVFSLLLKNKAVFVKIVFALVFSTAISVLLLKFVSNSSGNLLELQPFWFLETMLAISDRFSWPRLYEAIINWRAAHTYHKAIAGYLVALVIFVVGNFGTRVFSFFSIKPKGIFKLTLIDSFLLSVIAAGIVAPTFFVQAGTAWNTIQFFYYSLFFLAIYSAQGVVNLTDKLKSERARRILVVLIVLFTVPTTISTLVTVYLPGRPPAVLPFDEQEALHFLKKLPQGIVLTYPFDPIAAKEAITNPPRPLYLYDSTAYVAAFANQPVFLEDEVNLTIMNYAWKDRRAQVDSFYNSYGREFTHDFLREHNISYIYWAKPYRSHIGDLQLRLENVFENQSVIIYRVIQ